MLRLRDAAGRDRRLHRVHHLELSAGAHRARRPRSHRHRVPAHAGDRAARARQLRQPAGVVGDAGRQGRAAQPGLRRQRHGQRHDRGERRPRRRRERTAWTKSRSSATSRTPGFVAKRRNMHYDILGDPFFRERDVPRMLELATAREAGDTSVPAELVNYPARSAAGKKQRSQPPDLAGLMNVVPRGLDLPDRPRRRFETAWVAVDGGRIVAVGGIRDREPAGPGAGSRDLGRRRAPAGPRQRAHPSRAVVAARSRAAGARLHRLGQDSCSRSAARPGRRTMPADQLAPIRDAIARSCAAVGHRGGRRHQQLARVGRADARGRARRRRVSRAARIQGARRRAGRARRATRERAAAAAGRARVAGAARAVFDVARAVPRDPGGGQRDRRARSRACISASRRKKSSSSRRAAARGAACSR